MNNTWKSQACKVPIGTDITGKWHKNTYKIIKPLGSGATGVVYLADSLNGLVAIKISENSMSITSEVNVLKTFQKVQGTTLGPSLLDVDDWQMPGGLSQIPFYVMEYVNGEDFLSFIEKRGKEWGGILCVQLLANLNQLHKEGWVFGDLKPENLLVVGPPPKIRWLDVGGTTLIGRAIKEFTEFFDRGYWGLGGRKAEPSYDLFAVAMIMINSAYPKRFQRSGGNGRDQLKKVILSNELLKKYASVLLNAIDGKYQSADEMREDFVKAMSQIDQVDSITPQKTTHQLPRQKGKSSQQYRQNQKKSQGGGFLETVLIIAFVLLAYVLYIYGQLI